MQSSGGAGKQGQHTAIGRWVPGGPGHGKKHLPDQFTNLWASLFLTCSAISHGVSPFDLHFHPLMVSIFASNMSHRLEGPYGRLFRLSDLRGGAGYGQPAAPISTQSTFA
jgi:hypothetical protein